MKRIGIVLLAVCAAGWLAGCGAAAALTMAKAENGCQVVDCDRKVYEDGLCRRHHRMAERGETLELKADQMDGETLSEQGDQE